MITDDERREVARKLREIELMRLPDSDSEMEAIHEAVGCWFGQPHFDQEVTDRLADLIEPPAQVEFAPKPTCNRDSLLALADEMTVEKGDIWRWSRRIREALGVDDGR